MTLVGHMNGARTGEKDCRYLLRETRFIQQVDETNSTEGGPPREGRNVVHPIPVLEWMTRMESYDVHPHL